MSFKNPDKLKKKKPLPKEYIPKTKTENEKAPVKKPKKKTI